MSKVGGKRNFGFGKQMAWAGRQAIADRYGQGHYGSVAAHSERWGQFVAWAKGHEIRDARKITDSVVSEYGREIATQVREGSLKVSYAQNLLSTVNVVMEALRGDRNVRVSPSAFVGERGRAREMAPAGVDANAVGRCARWLAESGQERVACVAELARHLGLRAREASLLDTRAALKKATAHGRVNITAGTKGGRGHRVDRWVPVSGAAAQCLARAAAIQGSGRNLIPAGHSWRQWNDHLHHVWSGARARQALGKLHDLRAAYACERYCQLTGHHAPVLSSGLIGDRDTDRAAREVIANELGHSRVEVVAAYVGSVR